MGLGMYGDVWGEMGLDRAGWGWVGMGVLKEILIKDKDMMEIEELKKIIRDVPDFPRRESCFATLQL